MFLSKGGKVIIPKGPWKFCAPCDYYRYTHQSAYFILGCSIYSKSYEISAINGIYFSQYSACSFI